MAESVILRVGLGLQLKRLRLQARKTAADVQEAGIGSRGKLAYIEKGRRAPRISDVREMCRLYRADDETTNRLAELARQAARGTGWWQEYGGTLPQWFSTFVELETAASKQGLYHGELVPGLLQTPRYHASLFPPEASSEHVSKQLEVRTQRQKQAWDRPEPLAMTAILGHGALTRVMGDESVMEEQLEHLRRMGERPGVEILVVPPGVPYHPGMKCPYTVLEFGAEEMPPLVYLESLYGGLYYYDVRAVEQFRSALEQIRFTAVSIEEFN